VADLHFASVIGCSTGWAGDQLWGRDNKGVPFPGYWLACRPYGKFNNRWDLLHKMSDMRMSLKGTRQPPKISPAQC